MTQANPSSPRTIPNNGSNSNVPFQVRKLSTTLSTTPFFPLFSADTKTTQIANLNSSSSFEEITTTENNTSLSSSSNNNTNKKSNRNRKKERDPMERFFLYIRFTDTQETVRIPEVSKFWTVGDVSRRVLKIRQELLEQKMGLPGVYFPIDQERIVMKYKDKQRTCTLSSMENALKNKFYYSPARDEADDLYEATACDDEEEEGEIDFDREDDGDDEFWRNRNNNNAAQQQHHLSPSPVPTSTNRNQQDSSKRKRKQKHHFRKVNTHADYVDSSDEDRKRKGRENNPNYKKKIRNKNDDDYYYSGDSDENDDHLDDDAKYTSFQRFHHAEDFHNEFAARRLQAVGDGGGAGENKIGNNNSAEDKKAGVARRKTSGGKSGSEIRLSRQGQYFNDPHQSLEDLGITYDASLYHERNGSLLQLEAEVVQNLIFGRAILKRA